MKKTARFILKLYMSVLILQPVSLIVALFIGIGNPTSDIPFIQFSILGATLVVGAIGFLLNLIWGWFDE